VLVLEENLRVNQSVIIENRKKFIISGVKDVFSFDEETVMLDTVLGKLVIKGDSLHILNFNNESKDITGEGKIHAMIYTQDEKNGGFFSKLFR
jgi:sporulation protein YabP